MCDILLAREGTGLIYYPLFNYDDGDLEAQRHLLEHPNTIIGLADSGAHVGTIRDASFPTTLLTHWVRDRTRGPRVSLESAIKAQTADTAAAYGQRPWSHRALHARGEITYERGAATTALPGKLVRSGMLKVPPSRHS